LSTPLPKLAISRNFSPDWLNTEASMRSVTVGTRTSATLTASASVAWLIGLSSRLSLASNSSHMRVSTLSGSLRVTTTSGFLPFGIRSLGFLDDGRLNDGSEFSAATGKDSSVQASLTQQKPMRRKLPASNLGQDGAVFCLS